MEIREEDNLGAVPDLAEALLEAGALTGAPWVPEGTLAKNLSAAMQHWAHSGDRLRPEPFKYLDLDLQVTPDIRALDGLYDSEAAHRHLGAALGIDGPIAGFALYCDEGAGRMDVGPALCRVLEVCTPILGKRGATSLAASIMGTLTCSLSLIGGWSPAFLMEEAVRLDEMSYEEDEDGNSPERWLNRIIEEIPEWFFCAKYNTRRLREAEACLASQSGPGVPTTWRIVDTALELARAHNKGQSAYNAAAHKARQTGATQTPRGIWSDDSLQDNSYWCWPPIALGWGAADEVDGLDAIIDYDMDMVYETETTHICWLFGFDARPHWSRGPQVEMALDAVSLVLKIVGALDRLLDLLVDFRLQERIRVAV